MDSVANQACFTFHAASISEISERARKVYLGDKGIKHWHVGCNVDWIKRQSRCSSLQSSCSDGDAVPSIDFERHSEHSWVPLVSKVSPTQDWREIATQAYQQPVILLLMPTVQSIIAQSCVPSARNIHVPFKFVFRPLVDERVTVGFHPQATLGASTSRPIRY